MKAYPFFTAGCLTVCLTTLAGCAPYQLATHAPEIEPVSETVVYTAPQAPVNPQPSFKDFSPSAWTVQIAALKDLQTMTSVESHNRLADVIRVPTRDPELGELNTVLVGVYDSLTDAQRVADKLPNKVAGDDPWIRSVASVQAVMR